MSTNYSTVEEVELQSYTREQKVVQFFLAKKGKKVQNDSVYQYG